MEVYSYYVANRCQRRSFPFASRINGLDISYDVLSDSFIFANIWKFHEYFKN